MKGDHSLGRNVGGGLACAPSRDAYENIPRLAMEHACVVKFREGDGSRRAV